MTTLHTYTLAITCPDRVGLVAAVSGLIARRGGWILEANHHADADTGRFFMRNVIRADSLLRDGARIEDFCAEVTELAGRYGMQWRLADSARRKRMVLLVSRHDHCLVDVLSRWRAGEFNCEIPLVISNHEELRGYVEWHGIEFQCVPVPAEGADRMAAYEHIERLCEQAQADVIVLARYMQILPAAFTRRWPGRIINIHHSFLPSFAGARPYRQAFERGVKLIGATSHYVTEDLDEGPIIEQDVVRIDHGDAEDDLVRYGRDVERIVLARALKYHLEDRVLLNGARTVVFR